jgi:hypothetical protein
MDSRRKKLLTRVAKLLTASDGLEQDIEALASHDIAAASRCAGLLSELRRLLNAIGDGLLDGRLSDAQIDAQLAELDGGLALLGLDVRDEHEQDDEHEHDGDERDDEQMSEEEAREVGSFLERELRPRLLAIWHARAGTMNCKEFTACADAICALETIMNRLQDGDAPTDERALDNFLDGLVSTFSEAKEAE